MTLRDVRKPPPRSELHFFSGKIEEVDALKVAILGTDSAVGKRTTAWLLVDALRERAAARPSWSAPARPPGCRARATRSSSTRWSTTSSPARSSTRCGAPGRSSSPTSIVLEGQGSLLNPAYPGGFELLAAGRPDAVVLQHAPARAEYDGFPGYPLHPLEHQIRAIEIDLRAPGRRRHHQPRGARRASGVRARRAAITAETGLPAFDVLRDGAEPLAAVVEDLLEPRARGAGVTRSAPSSEPAGARCWSSIGWRSARRRSSPTG